MIQLARVLFFLVTCATAFFLFALEVSAQPELKQIHVITRHGSRTPLRKDAEVLLEGGGATLTPLGQKQLYDLGTWLRTRYNQDGWLEFYDAAEVRLESSNLDRTLTSANALSLGLFPLQAQAGNYGAALFQSLLPEMTSLPVYSRQEVNDIYLRAYRNCPKFLKNLGELYDTQLWTTLEQNHMPLLKLLAEHFPDESRQEDDLTFVPLSGLWNVYDQMHVARTECSDDPSAFSCLGLEDPSLATALSDSEFEEVERLMEQTEQVKFGIATAQDLLGSNLLWQILDRVTTPEKLFLYSAHAPTVLGFMSAIQERMMEEQFVDYGSAVIVEVYEDGTTRELTIRLLYKAAKSSEARYMPLEHVDCTSVVGQGDDTTEHCLLTKFVLWTKENTLETEEAWCEACENESSDVCLRAQLDGSGGSLGMLQSRLNDLETALEESGNDPVVIAVTFFGGFVLGVLMMGVSCLCCGGCSRPENAPRSESTEEDTANDRVSAPIEQPTVVEARDKRIS